MKDLSRRDFLKYSGVIGATVGLGVTGVIDVSDAASEFEWCKPIDGNESRVCVPYFPFLSVVGDEDFWKKQSDVFQNGGELNVNVKNNGIKASSIVVVEAYTIDIPFFGGYSTTDVKINSSKFISRGYVNGKIYPGETKNIKLNVDGLKSQKLSGYALVVAYDPVLDSKPSFSTVSAPWREVGQYKISNQYLKGPFPDYHMKYIAFSPLQFTHQG